MKMLPYIILHSIIHCTFPVLINGFLFISPDQNLQVTMSGGIQPPLTTHILDTARGKPAGTVPMVLSIQEQNGDWKQLETGTTSIDGRGGFLTQSTFHPAVYKLYFDTGAYFKKNNLKGFYPYVEVVFQIEDEKQHYHVPLLLSPYGYSTYRGS
ncbi:5-hydroxyisourate hydrolase-like isoform X2 [Mytilus trossulus]|uniref:5-hydroxyisourate hydrolase-like isoform X2 n=1 Tax=Mytilus trossulus TaxID=6551 RepID=UPI0030040EC8